MEKLVLDGTTLLEGVRNIKAAKEEFESIGESMSGIKDAVGGSAAHRLSSQLQSATDAWSVHRDKLSAALQTLGDQLAGVIEAFGTADKDMADQLCK